MQNSETKLQIVTLFSSSMKGMLFYPPSHPSIKKPLMELFKLITSYIGDKSEISIGIIDGILFIDNHLFLTPTTALFDLSGRFIEKNIGRIIFLKGLNFNELQEFVKLLSNKSSNFESIAHSIEKQQIKNISLLKMGEESFDPHETLNEPAFYGCNRDTYNHALDAIRGVCKDIERGRIPNSAPVIKVVDKMVGITMQDPSALIGLTMIKDYDNYTFNHCINVGVLSMALGAASGFDANMVRTLGLAGQLHDIGKTMIPKKILNKPGKLNSEEFDEIKKHPEYGAKIVQSMDGIDKIIAQIVLGHHLNSSRTGYPAWAQKMPFNAMVDVVAIADTYDAITTLRVYQHPVSPRQAITEMQSLIGKILDAEYMAKFIALMGRYPVGTLVRLDNNEVAVIYKPNPIEPEFPVVRVLIDEDGKRLSAPIEVKLMGQDGEKYASISAVVDPFLKNIDVGQYLMSGIY